MRKIIILTFLLFAACSMPETKIYSLYMPAEKISTNKKTGASIVVLVDSPRYLLQPYIAHRTSPYQLSISRYSKWDATPSRSVRDAFKEALSSTGMFKEVRAAHAAPAGYYSLKISLKKFELLDIEGGPFGELDFDASFLSPEGAELYNCSVSRRVKLEDKTFLSLAKGLSEALRDEITHISNHVINAFASP